MWSKHIIDELKAKGYWADLIDPDLGLGVRYIAL
jgi:hypothetical protein